jgi:hypothetical protein
MDSNTHVSGAVLVPRFALYGLAALSVSALVSSVLVITSARRPAPPAVRTTRVEPPPAPKPAAPLMAMAAPIEAKAPPPTAAAPVESIESQEVDVVDRPAFDITFKNTDEMKAHVEALYFEETVDRAWASIAEVTLLKGLEKIMPEGSRAERVECKSTMCRIDLVHQDTSLGPGLFFRQIANERPWNAPIHTTAPEPDASGVVRNNAYIAREGHPIPGIAE